jgi:lysozyme
MKINTGGRAWIAGSFMTLVIAIASAIAVSNEGERRTAYPDPAGHGWAICFGHTQGVKRGDTATDAQCRAWLAQDMAVAYRKVDRCITAALTVTQAAAFTDAAYNLPSRVVCDSTLQRLANSGHVEEACEQLPIWDHPEWLKGIHVRRDQEHDVCRNGLH